MTETNNQDIINDIKAIHKKLTEYSEKAQGESFLSYYENSPLFLHCSSDGKMRDYEAFKHICAGYYHTLIEQKISTTFEKYNVFDKNLVILSWTGNIFARFKNGNTMHMKNYSITSVFRKSKGKWNIIYSHESALPPEIIKRGP
ncbi:MAG TPA: nuclear transport factor 2 family protein [Puia sp.]|nr:nuclear transport factor 2 family protein [Puia sp.]